MIEDILKELSVALWEKTQVASGKHREITRAWDRKFINDVSHRMGVDSNLKISSNQLTMLERITDEYDDILEARNFPKHLVSDIIKNKRSRRGIKEQERIVNEVRVIDDSVIGFRYRYVHGFDAALSKIKTLISNERVIVKRYTGYNLTTITVSSENANSIIELISKFGFSFDDEVAELLFKLTNIAAVKPTVDYVGDEIVITDVTDPFIQSALSRMESIHGC